MMSLFWTLIFLSLAFSVNWSESRNQKKKLPSAVLVGTVYCDTCFHQDFPKASRVIEGATVAVECKSTRSSPSFRQEVKTDNRGEFKVNLPFSVSKHVKKIKGCSVKLISSNEPYCAVAATATSTSLNLKSRKEGVHIFSAGFFTFKPLNQPLVCDQKPRIGSFKKQRVDYDKSSMVLNADDPAFLQPVQDPPYNPPVLGHLPSLPRLPQLPQLPPLPGIPYLPPVPAKETAIKPPKLSDEEIINQPAASNIPFVPNPLNPPIFPPNPLLPPLALLPPVVPSPPASIFPPVFPAPPATIFPPVLPSPPSPPAFKLPPIPGFTPPAPPPQPPFPISFPPFPFQPTPGFPGVPPADTSSSP